MSALVTAFLFATGVFIWRSIYIVQQSTVIVVERLGRFHRVLDAGLHFIVPFIDAPRPFMLDGRMRPMIDLREQVLDFPPQAVITRDNVTMQVDSVIYYQITEPRKALYEIENLTVAIRQLAITNLRNIMGELALDETLTARETVNTKLRMALDDATDRWGVRVSRVELKNINPPLEIEEAMAKQMKAERVRRAVVTEAEGMRSAQVMRAEGERDASIAEAEGRRQATILNADGEAEAIRRVNAAKADALRLVFSALHDANPTKDVLAVRYMETLEAIAKGDANKVFIPYDVMNVIGSLGALANLRDATTDVRPGNSNDPANG